MPDTDPKVRLAAGLQIKQARQQRRWSQAKLAHMLNGSAIDCARKIDPRNIVITERQAGLYIDVAKAFAQWGKFDRSYAPAPVAREAHGLLTRTGCLQV